jgi:diguanylate cyclase (GGDEF)-like protein/PAS domain S-box-containing protein
MKSTNIEPPVRQSVVSLLRDLAFVAIALGLLVYGATWLNATSWGADSVSILWPSAGLLLGILLCRPRRQWPLYLGVAFAIDMIVNLTSLNESLPIATYLAGCNLVEILFPAWLLYPAISAKPDLTRPKQLISLIIYGVVLAPTFASLLASVAIEGHFRQPSLDSFVRWFASDALGIAIVTPLYFSLPRRTKITQLPWFEASLLFAALCIVSIAVFRQTSLPLLFVVLPFLLLLEVRLGLAGASTGLLAVSIIGGSLTAQGRGPVALNHLLTLSQRTEVLQFFIAVCMVVLYIVELVRAERNRFELDLIASEARFRGIAEVSQDMIVLKRLDGTRLYVSPVVKNLLGWSPEEFCAMPYEDTVHPDDVSYVLQAARDCIAKDSPRTFEYRARTKDGRSLWMEANLTLYRDPKTNQPSGLVKVVRDISNRKINEEELNKALNEAASMATTDALTGIPNRRAFNQFLDVEWRRAARAHVPISLLLIDVDHFKRYNDIYGHLAGDHCLKQIAQAIRAIVHRSSDHLARYGGEEFSVILPNTDIAGTKKIAEHIRKTVEECHIPHHGNSHLVVTLSIGCATQIPRLDLPSASLVERADNALYLAKSSGRNRVASESEVDSSVAQ